MTDTALKFGPEWLRELSHGGVGGGRGGGGGGMHHSSPPLGGQLNHLQGGPPPLEAPRYKIAEFRYGREEMLSLFNKNTPLPDYMQEFSSIVTEHCQLPLALIQVTEEEQSMWARSVNSDLLQRMGSKTRDGGVPPAPGAGPPSGMIGSGAPVTSLRGRGGSVDRGRGRGRGNYFQRGLSFEDGEGGPPNVGGFTRGGRGGFERSQSISDRDQRWDTDSRERRMERPFPVRDENGLVRKEISRAPNDTWRRDASSEKAKSGVDEDGWHTAPTRDKWGKTNSSWRSDHRDEADRPPVRGDSSEPLRNGPSRPPPFRKPNPWDQEHDHNRDYLPEWSTENGCDAEQVGTFDSSGAFMETKNSMNGPIPKRRPSNSEEKPKDVPVIRKPRQMLESLVSAPPDPDATKEVQRQDPPPPSVSAVPTDAPRGFEPTVAKDMDQKVSQNGQPKGAGPVEKQTVILTSVSSAPYVPVVAMTTMNSGMPHVVSVPMAKPSEDENFDMLEKAAENMMAQWTAEEEHRVVAQQQQQHHLLSHSSQAQGLVSSVDGPVVPLHHSDAYKWFYRDPQSQVQGPFTSTEMLEWSTAGYFTTNLMVRRGCDEKFSTLGELIKVFGRMPFTPGHHVPPLRSLSSSPLLNNSLPPVTSGEITPPTSSAVPSSITAEDEQRMRLIFLQQQILHQQLLYRQQIQMQSMLAQLNKQESFSSLPQQQQQQVLFKHLLAQQQHLQRAPPGGMVEGLPGGILDPLTPLLGMNAVPSLPKNDPNLLWGLNSTAATTVPVVTGIPNSVTGAWPGLNTVGGLPQTKPPVGNSTSIWDLDVPASQVDLQAAEKKEQEEKEKEAKRQEEENRRLLEEQKRRRDEEELQRRIEMEEKRREQLKKEEEERREAAEKELLLREAEEKKRQEEEAEKKRLEEEEQRCRVEAEKRRRKEAEIMRKQEEEIKRRQDEENQRILQEMERQRKEEQERREEQQREALRRLQQEQAQRAIKAPTVAPWAQQTAAAVSSVQTPSLAEIQRLQEEREREEKLRMLQQQQQQQQQQQLELQQQQQQLQMKNQLTWANKTVQPSSVKTLVEIQQEEAERAAKQQKQQLKQQNANPLQHSASAHSNLTGGWNNAASQLNWTPSQNVSSQGWALNDVSNTTAARGFWDEAASATVRSNKTASKVGGESAFPALDKSSQNSSHTGSSNKAKNIRSKKKDEETVMKLFETHSRPETDEFTLWCTKALSNMQSSVDVPTFTTFLKDIESPYEVHDYVRSYLGESKEAREFAKQFLERRSKHRNQSKQKASEENMWGPAPALTPLQNKPGTGGGANQHSSGPGQFSLLGAGDEASKNKKKKKGKMQRLDGALLGFRVQADPDRINAGEIDHVDGV